MEKLLRFCLLLAVFALALWVPKFLQEHPVGRDIERLEAEVRELRLANDLVRQENQRYRTLVQGLREDPRVMDRKARETLGMSRADEIVVWFAEEDRPTNPSR